MRNRLLQPRPCIRQARRTSLNFSLHWKVVAPDKPGEPLDRQRFTNSAHSGVEVFNWPITRSRNPDSLNQTSLEAGSFCQKDSPALRLSKRVECHVRRVQWKDLTTSRVEENAGPIEPQFGMLELAGADSGRGTDSQGINGRGTYCQGSEKESASQRKTSWRNFCKQVRLDKSRELKNRKKGYCVSGTTQARTHSSRHADQPGFIQLRRYSRLQRSSRADTTVLVSQNCLPNCWSGFNSRQPG